MRIHTSKSDFSKGEITSDLYGRTDTDAYQGGLQTLENAYVLPSGAVKRRPEIKVIPGTSFQCSTPTCHDIHMFEWNYARRDRWIIILSGGFEDVGLKIWCYNIYSGLMKSAGQLDVVDFAEGMAVNRAKHVEVGKFCWITIPNEYYTNGMPPITLEVIESDLLGGDYMPMATSTTSSKQYAYFCRQGNGGPFTVLPNMDGINATVKSTSSSGTTAALTIKMRGDTNTYGTQVTTPVPWGPLPKTVTKQDMIDYFSNRVLYLDVARGGLAMTYTLPFPTGEDYVNNFGFDRRITGVMGTLTVNTTGEWKGSITIVPWYGILQQYTGDFDMNIIYSCSMPAFDRPTVPGGESFPYSEIIWTGNGRRDSTDVTPGAYGPRISISWTGALIPVKLKLNTVDTNPVIGTKVDDGIEWLLNCNVVVDETGQYVQPAYMDFPGGGWIVASGQTDVVVTLRASAIQYPDTPSKMDTIVWPSLVAMSNGRLIMNGFEGENWFHFSRPQQWDSFESYTPSTDAGGIDVGLAFDGDFRPNNIISGDKISILSPRGTYGIEPLSQGALSPSNIRAYKQSDLGGSYIDPISIKAKTLFVSPNRKSIIAREYNLINESYTFNDLELLSSHLFDEDRKITSMTYWEDPYPQIICTTETRREFRMLAYDPEDGITGWSKHYSDLQIYQVLAINGIENPGFPDEPNIENSSSEVFCLVRDDAESPGLLTYFHLAKFTHNYNVDTGVGPNGNAIEHNYQTTVDLLPFETDPKQQAIQSRLNQMVRVRLRYGDVSSDTQAIIWTRDENLGDKSIAIPTGSGGDAGILMNKAVMNFDTEMYNGFSRDQFTKIYVTKGPFKLLGIYPVFETDDEDVNIQQ